MPGGPEVYLGGMSNNNTFRGTTIDGRIYLQPANQVSMYKNVFNYHNALQKPQYIKLYL